KQIPSNLVRQLRNKNIVAQWHAATHQVGIRPKNIVFMDMGEPTDNLHTVIPAIRVLAGHDSPAIAASNISASTVSNPDGIRRLSANSLPNPASTDSISW
ncbi:MAG: hypothetical protein P8J87_18180, partial [Verrucomicrobiales bacterium]|nr:hypothetical protein [Verrucomicrobiales bacterium]